VPHYIAPIQGAAAQRQNRPEIPDVARQDAMCFAYYTRNQGVLKLTAQLVPLQAGETREATLAVNYGRKPLAWLPEVEAPAGITTPVVQVVDERSGEVVYPLRSKTPCFKPGVFAEGSYTVMIGDPPARMKILNGQRSAKL
jgi:hypothetical protein